MKASDLKTKSALELKAFLSELRRKQFKLRLVKVGGEMKETHEIRETRRNIARIETILTEKEKVSS
jgi:large subunit ribosomal protein L29